MVEFLLVARGLASIAASMAVERLEAIDLHPDGTATQ